MRLEKFSKLVVEIDNIISGKIYYIHLQLQYCYVKSDVREILNPLCIFNKLTVCTAKRTLPG